MKKVLSILLLFIVYVSNAQTDYIPNKVQFGVTPISNNIDHLATLSTNGFLNKSTVTIEDVANLLTIDFSQYLTETTADLRYLQLSGGNLTGKLVIDPLSSAGGIFDADFTVRKESNTETTAVSSFTQITNEHTSTLNTAVVGGISLSENNATVSTAGLEGFISRGRHNGSEDIGYIYGMKSDAIYNGSGNVDFLISHPSFVKVQGTGAGTINYARGNGITIDNPNATVNYAQAHHPAIILEQGTLQEEGSVMFLDIDVNQSNLGSTLNVNGDFSYIQGGGGSDVPLLKNHLASKGKKLRFIHGQGEIESDFDGLINYLGDVSNYDTATDKALTNIEYTDANYVKKDVVHKVGDVGEPIFQNGWSNFSPNYSSVSFYKIGSKVFIDGTISGGSSAIVFTLPLEFRPSKTSIHPIIARNSLGRVDIYPNGDVSVVLSITDTSSWVSLSQISFNLE